MDKKSELAKLRGAIATLQAQADAIALEVEGPKVDSQPSGYWNNSGCTIDEEDWEYSASHWGDDGWESSYC